jgi:hypothetical protein
MQHSINTNTYIITNGEYTFAQVRGIADALEQVNMLQNKRGVSIYENGSYFCDATFFASWARRMDNLINRGIGWNGEVKA